MAKIVLISLVHQRKNLVGLALQSAVNQTLDKSKWIHLVINNFSTDGAKTVCETFAKKYPNVKLVNMDKNLGQQKAYNWALNEWIPKNAPEADVISILDSDDVLTTDALSEVVKMFDAHPEIGAAYSGFGIIGGAGEMIVKDHPKARLIPNQFTPEGQLALRRSFVGKNGNICGHLRSYRIKCLLDIGGFNTNYEYATDYNIFGRILEKYPVVKINRVLYKFRQHRDQVQSKHSPQQTKDWNDLQKEFKERWEKTGII